MTHQRVYEQFKIVFPIYISEVVEYFQNGKDSIRVKFSDHTEYVFTFTNSSNWRFETRDSFIKNTLIKKKEK